MTDPRIASSQLMYAGFIKLTAGQPIVDDVVKDLSRYEEIPGLQKAYIGTSNDDQKGGGYDIFVVFFFRDSESLAAYQENPYHLAIAAKYSKRLEKVDTYTFDKKWV